MSRREALATWLVLALAGCAPSWKHAPHDLPFQRAAPPRLHPIPAVGEEYDWWDRALHSTLLPLGHLVSPAYYLATLGGGPRALDVNQLGEVPDSTWFESRIGRRPLSPAELQRGPNRTPPDLDHPLVVTAGNIEGASAGMVVRDSTGARWYAKFDPPAHPEMTTGAEMIASRLLWAAGYHIPELYLVKLDLSRLQLDPAARTRDDYHRSIPLDQRGLRNLLTQLNPDREGRVRAVLSREIPGRLLGPFSYRRCRPDDPNDKLPHDRRRSLRGLGLLSAWINNTDTRRQNTMDSFVPVSADGRLGYVRHYLLDFGDALGATATGEKSAGEGYEGGVDWIEIAKRTLALGLKYPYWYQVRRSPYRSIGIFEGEVFDPARWAPLYPNPAFAEATLEDLFWAATILARFRPDLIAAAVATAEYSEPGAAAYVAEVLEKRRAKLLDHLFSRMLALVDPEVTEGYQVTLTDLEVVTGAIEPPARYWFAVRWNRTGRADVELGRGTTDLARAAADHPRGMSGVTGPRIDLRAAVREVMLTDPSGFARDPFLTLTLRRNPGEPAVDLHLRVVRDHLLPVAIRRQAGWVPRRPTRRSRAIHREAPRQLRTTSTAPSGF